MQSRRGFLASAAAAGTAALAGCSNPLSGPSGTEAYLQWKSVGVRWQESGEHRRSDVLFVRHRVEDGVIEGRYDPDWMDDVVEAPRDLSVSAARHSELKTRFDTVEYVLGACGEGFSDGGDAVGCLNQRAGREDFNAVPLTGRAELVDRNDQFDVRSVERDAFDVSEVSLQAVAYDAAFDDE
jgi:hypothetical protein